MTGAGARRRGATGLALATLVGAAWVAAASHATAQEGTAAPNSAATAQAGARFMELTADAVLRNFEDENGAVLATLSKGTLVRSFRESQGKPVFSEVEVAGGFPVWVYGRYLQPTDVDGVLLVTGNRVNMRPMPNSTPASMPLRSKLDAGQRVRMVERAMKAAAFGEDWIRIQAPTRAKAWIESSALTPVTSDRMAKARWDEASKPLPIARPRPVSSLAPAGANRPAPAGRTGEGTAAAASARVSPDVLKLLIDADTAFDAATSLQSPTTEAWRDVIAAYDKVLEAAPETSLTYQKASERLTQSKLTMEVVAIREDMNMEQRAKDRKIREIDRFLEQQQQRKNPRWGRFEERGWLEARERGGITRWYLVFGGETLAEVKCMTRRYDLGVFEGFEIGVIGREISPVVRSTATSRAEARVIDAQGIEVISASARARRR